MTTSIHTKRLGVVVVAVSAAIALGVPPAHAQSPDAFERALNARQSDSKWMLDARERALTERPAAAIAPGSDAFERAMINRTDELTRQTAAMLDARERAQSVRPAGELQQPTGSSSRFDWSDFGLGAGAGVGLMLLVLGLSVGVLATRRDGSRVETA